MIALSVQEAEKHERFNETFYTKYDDSVKMSSRSHHKKNKPRRPADTTQAIQQSRGQRYTTSRNTNKRSQSQGKLRCYECEGRGHFARECPTRLHRENRSSDQPRKENPSEPRVSRSTDSKPPREVKRGVKKEAKQQGNANEV